MDGLGLRRKGIAGDPQEGLSLRTRLRNATRIAHDSLDRSISAIGWSDPAQYSRFLKVQHAARKPFEAWAVRDCPQTLTPPEQTGLIEADLAELGEDAPQSGQRFCLPFGAAPIGAAWAMAGSSLGNAKIMQSLPRNGDKGWPSQFLSSAGMREFWTTLRPQLDTDTSGEDAEPAIDAALAVFDHFQATVERLKGALP